MLMGSPVGGPLPARVTGEPRGVVGGIDNQLDAVKTILLS
jgi:hypothetical protein